MEEKEKEKEFPPDSARARSVVLNLDANALAASWHKEKLLGQFDHAISDIQQPQP